MSIEVLGAARRPGIARRMTRVVGGGGRFGVQVAVGFLAVMCVLAILAPLVAPYSPSEVSTGPPLSLPAASHLLGTDELGRDLLSRLLYGARLSLAITASATLIALVLGTIWGATAALRGRWVDELLMRLVDVVMAIPLLLLALIFVAAFGVSTVKLALIIGILHVPWTARILRAACMAELQRDYVVAARSFGTTKLTLASREIAPNVAQILLAQASLVAASALLIESTLSFVGLGVLPPQASWATLLLDGYERLGTSLWFVTIPCLLIFLTIWALNTVGDWFGSRRV